MTKGDVKAWRWLVRAAVNAVVMALNAVWWGWPGVIVGLMATGWMLYQAYDEWRTK